VNRRILPLFVIAGILAGLLLSPAPTGCRPRTACPVGHACCGFKATPRLVAIAVKVALTVPALVPSRELLLASAAERGHDGFHLARALPFFAPLAVIQLRI
jgi:hypothetical protein